MVEVTQELAERISDVARLLEDDDEGDPALLRLSGLGVDLVPGATGAAVTITADGEAYTFAASDVRIEELHRLQFASGQGPVVETLRYNEARHVRDTSTEERWRTFCRASARVGVYSLIAAGLVRGEIDARQVRAWASSQNGNSRTPNPERVVHKACLLTSACGPCCPWLAHTSWTRRPRRHSAPAGPRRYRTCTEGAPRLRVPRGPRSCRGWWRRESRRW